MRAAWNRSQQPFLSVAGQATRPAAQTCAWPLSGVAAGVQTSSFAASTVEDGRERLGGGLKSRMLRAVILSLKLFPNYLGEYIKDQDV